MATIEQLRIILSILLFIFGCYFVYDLFANGFDFLVLLLMLAGFYLAKLMWPKYSRMSDRYEWLESVGEIIEFPISIFIQGAKFLAQSARLMGDD
ncbi:hypothetical protein [Bacterioplanoides sp.]|uniref:hypothetical protein n=1 Tax=Bacterioplanoides sp. TaxID=2066072 RepID=UPI003B5BD298